LPAKTICTSTMPATSHKEMPIRLRCSAPTEIHIYRLKDGKIAEHTIVDATGSGTKEPD